MSDDGNDDDGGEGSGGDFGKGGCGSGRTLRLALRLPSLTFRLGLTASAIAAADVGVSGSGCVGGGDSGRPRGAKRGCVERGRGRRRGASMSSELKNTGGGCVGPRVRTCPCVRGSTGSTRLPPSLPRELPLSRAARPGKLVRRRSRNDGRRAVFGGAGGGGLLEGGGGGDRGKGGALGYGFGVVMGTRVELDSVLGVMMVAPRKKGS